MEKKSFLVEGISPLSEQELADIQGGFFFFLVGFIFGVTTASIFFQEG